MQFSLTFFKAEMFPNKTHQDSGLCDIKSVIKNTANDYRTGKLAFQSPYLLNHSIFVCLFSLLQRSIPTLHRFPQETLNISQKIESIAISTSLVTLAKGNPTISPAATLAAVMSRVTPEQILDLMVAFVDVALVLWVTIYFLFKVFHWLNRFYLLSFNGQVFEYPARWIWPSASN